MKLVTVEQMKNLEQAADAAGHSYDAMMERAGHAVAEAIQDALDLSGKCILILAGPGNNGGDGLVAGRYLAQAGAEVAVYLWRPRQTNDPNFQRLQDHDVRWLSSGNSQDDQKLREAMETADVIVDALLGTGVDRPLEGGLADVLRAARHTIHARRGALTPDKAVLNASLKPCRARAEPFVVAVDVPSGVNCDTGAVDPATLSADLTVTFGAAKRGQFRFPAANVCGTLIVADIGFPPALTAPIRTEVAAAFEVAQCLPARPADAHKGSFGKAMVVAGSINYTGAPFLAGAAAGRVGAGLVTVALPASLHPIVAARLAEATYLPLPHDAGHLIPGASRELTEKLPGYAALLVGPGLGQDAQTCRFVYRLLGVGAGSKSGQMGFRLQDSTEPPSVELPPLVVDADALNALAEVDHWWTYLPSGSVLTPHPGEMARLTGRETAEVNEDRVAIATAKSIEWGQTLVLKGALTVVAAPDGRATVIPFATAALATAGTGDVLAGCIAGLLAQGLGPYDAALCGAYLHGLAGKMLAQELGNAGTLAGDLLIKLPQAMQALR
jgi:NAD(P)H-hydrate epimerase